MNEVNAVTRLYGRSDGFAGVTLAQLAEVLAYTREAQTGLDDYFGDSYVTESVVIDLVKRVTDLERQMLTYKMGLIAITEGFPNV